MMNSTGLFIFLIYNIFMPLSAFADSADGGSEAGNGGKVIACPGSGNMTLLDDFEANSIYHFVPDDHCTDDKQCVQQTLARLRIYSPARANLYEDQLNHFYDEAVMVTGPLPDVPDSFEVYLPPGCHVRQAVIQNPRPKAGEPRYRVDQEVWNHLSSYTKAGLLFHEVIYREAIGYGQKDSINARHFNGWIRSKELGFSELISILEQIQFPSLDFVTDDLDDFVFNLELKNYDGHLIFFDRPYVTYDTIYAPIRSMTIHGQTFDLVGAEAEFYYQVDSNGKVISRSLKKITYEGVLPWRIFGGKAQLSKEINWNWNCGFDDCSNHFDATLAAPLHFETHHSIANCKIGPIWLARGSLADPAKPYFACNLDKDSSAIIDGKSVPVKGITFFYRDGRILESILQDPETFEVKGTQISVLGKIQLFPDGTIGSAFLSRSAVFHLDKTKVLLTNGNFGGGVNFFDHKKEHVFFAEGNIAGAQLAESIQIQCAFGKKLIGLPKGTLIQILHQKVSQYTLPEQSELNSCSDGSVQ